MNKSILVLALCRLLGYTQARIGSFGLDKQRELGTSCDGICNAYFKASCDFPVPISDCSTATALFDPKKGCERLCEKIIKFDCECLEPPSVDSKKVDYCHVDATGAVHLISISPNAIPAHEQHPLDHFPNESTGLCRDCPCNTEGTYFNDLLTGAEEYDGTSICTYADGCNVPVAEATRFGVFTDDGKNAAVTIGYQARDPTFETVCVSDTNEFIDLVGQEDNAQFCLDLLATVVTEFQEE